MNLIPEVLSITATLGLKFQVTPSNIAMLIAKKQIQRLYRFSDAPGERDRDRETVVWD